MSLSRVGVSEWRDDWGTPLDLFKGWHSVRCYSIDVFAQPHNALLPRFCEDAFTHNLKGERGYANPPYSRLDDCVRRLYLAVFFEGMVFCDLLVPAYTDSRWFQNYVWDSKRAAFRPGVSGNFLRGRLRFQGAKWGAPFGSMIVTFDSLDRRRDLE